MMAVYSIRDLSVLMAALETAKTAGMLTVAELHGAVQQEMANRSSLMLQAPPPPQRASELPLCPSCGRSRLLWSKYATGEQVCPACRYSIYTGH